jgi:hypothetical protein
VIEWLARIDEVLANRAERSAVAAAYAGRFTSARSAQRLIDLANLAGDRLNRQAPLKSDPVDDYLATWAARLPLRAVIPEPAQMLPKPRSGRSGASGPKGYRVGYVISYPRKAPPSAGADT